MAPEIVEKHSYDETVDLWSLGVLTFDMLCGHAPIDTHNPNPKLICNYEYYYY